MNKFIALLFMLSIPIFSIELQEEAYQFDNLQIIKNPKTISIGPISNEFLCEKAIPLQSIDFTSFTGLSPEIALILQCSQSAEELMKFYESVFQTREWRILQKDSKENKLLLLGESQTKKVMTVLIRDEKEYRIVKIFFKRPGF